MLTFTPEELQFILNAINEEVKRVGLNCAGIALVIASKLQNEAGRMAEDAKTADADAEETQGKKKKKD